MVNQPQPSGSFRKPDCESSSDRIILMTVFSKRKSAQALVNGEFKQVSLADYKGEKSEFFQTFYFVPRKVRCPFLLSTGLHLCLPD